jgi:murein DD-endopeptidase MepM/ murein hydrolase activator NlpD
MADAAPTRRSRRAAVAAAEEIAPVALTRAELRRRRAEEAAAVPAAEATPSAAEEPTELIGQEPTELSGQAPLKHPFDSIAEVVAEATAAAPTSRRRDRPHAEPGVSTLVDTVAADAIPLSFVAAVAEPCLVDEFERAARTFSFTGQTPIQADAVVEPPIVPVTSHVARRGRRAGRKRVAAASFSLGVMTIVGLLAVGTTTPWSAVAASSGATDIVALAPTPQATENIQAYVSSTDGESQLERSADYDVASMADLAADSGVTQFAGTWVNDPTADVQWPFPVGVPISAAYGSQSYLSKFSSPHRGVDLTPGAGAEIHVVADGTVRIATQAGGDYGVTVVVDHVVDGQLVSTRYAHMQYGSLQVATGDIVKAGDVIGRVGSTGKATGPHLHFEVLLGGTVHTDPMAWMRQHTDG